MNRISAAHKQLPFGTVVEVENRDNGRKLRLPINDRGPFIKGRIIDLSLGAARQLDMFGAGLARVRIRVVQMAPEVVPRSLRAKVASSATLAASLPATSSNGRLRRTLVPRPRARRRPKPHHRLAETSAPASRSRPARSGNAAGPSIWPVASAAISAWTRSGSARKLAGTAFRSTAGARRPPTSYDRNWRKPVSPRSFYADCGAHPPGPLGRPKSVGRFSSATVPDRPAAGSSTTSSRRQGHGGVNLQVPRSERRPGSSQKPTTYRSERSGVSAHPGSQTTQSRAHSPTTSSRRVCPSRRVRSSYARSRRRSMTAFWVCMRFSAWSKTRLRGPSTTEAVTSSPRWQGRQWR